MGRERQHTAAPDETVEEEEDVDEQEGQNDQSEEEEARDDESGSGSDENDEEVGDEELETTMHNIGKFANPPDLEHDKEDPTKTKDDLIAQLSMKVEELQKEGAAKDKQVEDLQLQSSKLQTQLLEIQKKYEAALEELQSKKA